MKFIAGFLLFAVVMIGHPFAQAAPASTFPEILDYYEMMKLPAAEREAYLRGVIDIVNWAERLNLYAAVDEETQAGVSRPPSAITWLLSLSSAEAVASIDCKPTDCPSGSIVYLSAGKLQQCLQRCPKGQKGEFVRCNLDYSCSSLCVEEKCSGPSAGVAPKVAPGPGGGGNAEIKPGADGTVQVKPGGGGEIDASCAKSKDPGDCQKRLEKEREAQRAEADAAAKKKKEAEKAGETDCEEITCPSEDPQYRFKVKEDFNKRVTSSKDVRCINGGMIGKYDIEGRKKCRPVQAAEFGPLKLTCGAGKTMCSPLLFGLAKDDPPKALCVDIGLEMTEQCMQKGGPEKARAFWKRSDISHEILAEEWKKLTSAFTDDLCREKASANYHCKECALIAQQLIKLNKMVDKCKNKCGKEVRCFFAGSTGIKGLEKGTDTQGGSGATPGANPGTTSGER